MESCVVGCISNQPTASKKKPWLSKFGWCRRNLGSRGVTLLQLLLSECLCWKREKRRRLKEGCIIKERSHSIAAVV